MVLMTERINNVLTLAQRFVLVDLIRQNWEQLNKERCTDRQAAALLTKAAREYVCADGSVGVDMKVTAANVRSLLRNCLHHPRVIKDWDRSIAAVGRESQRQQAVRDQEQIQQLQQLVRSLAEQVTHLSRNDQRLTEVLDQLVRPTGNTQPQPTTAGNGHG